MTGNQRRNWRSHANKLLKHLQQGTSLTPDNLHSLQITLQAPTPIIPLSAVIDYIPLFLESRKGKEWNRSLDFIFRQLGRWSESNLREHDLREFTADMLVISAVTMGNDRFWRDDDQNNKKWITPVVVGYVLLIKKLTASC